MTKWIKGHAKAIAAAVAQICTQVVSIGALSGTARTSVEVLGAVLTGLIVYQVPNVNA